MKKLILIAWVILLMVPAFTASAQKKVFVSKDVTATAGQIDFDYKGALKKAANKNSKAIVSMLEFSRIVDGKQAADHAITCLELIPKAGDWTMAKAIESVRPTLKAALLKRLVKAQNSTQKEALKKPIKSWAPYTWDALNNRPVLKPSTPLEMPADISGDGGSIQDANKATMPDSQRGGTGIQPQKKPAGRESGGN